MPPAPTEGLLRVRFTISVLASSLLFSWPGLASAEEPVREQNTPSGGIARVEDPADVPGKGDGVYGRFNGDVALEGGACVELATRLPSARVLFYADLSIYQTLGPYVTFRQSLSGGDDLHRLASVGLNLSPLFLLRWSNARQTGHAFFDLLIDSLELSAGFYGAEPRGAGLFDRNGFEGGVGLGVPLFARANGLWLRPRATLLTSSESPEFSAWFMLTYQGFAHTGLLSAGD